MRTITKVWCGVSFVTALLAGWAVWSFAQPPEAESKGGRGAEFPPRLEEEAKRMGVKPEDLLRDQRRFEMEMEKERIKQPPTLLAHGDALFVVRGPWLYQFDLQTLQLKNMQNLDFLTEQFFRKMEKEQMQKEPKKQ